MKDTGYVMKIIESWMTLDEIEGTSTRIYSINRSGTKDTKNFTYRQKFGLHFIYIHQVYENNNQRHPPIYL